MAGIELVAVGPAQESALLALARNFHAEDGHPLSERGEAAVGLIARGHPLGRAWLIHEDGRLIGYACLGLGFGIEYGGADAFVDDLYLCRRRAGEASAASSWPASRRRPAS